MDYHQYPPDMNNMMARQNDRSSPSFNTVVNQYMFNERSPSIMFDSNAIHSPPILSEEGNNSMMMMSTHPVPPVVPVSQNFQGPWNHPMLNVNDYAGSSRRQHQSTPSERGIAGFVSKLYQCLQSPENNQNYARWCQHDGKDMFVIDCIPEFTEIVLPRLFKHCKFASFVRQLNIYGFQRDTDARKSKDTKDKESCRWHHPCFKPNRRDLFHLIRRKATRYSRKSKAKIATEEDPETILNVGSGDDDESEEMDQENMILVVHDDNRRSSSASSATSMLPADYNTSQLQLTGGGLPSESVSMVNTSTLSSPNLMQHMSLDTGFTTPTLLHDNNVDLAGLTNSAVSDKTESNQDMVLDVQLRSEPFMQTEQELRLQVYHMKRKHQEDCREYEEQLNSALLQIDEQKIRIQQLEEALGFTEHSVKQSTNHQQTGGYMSTACATIPNSFNRNYLHLNNYQNSPPPHRILASSVYNPKSFPVNTPPSNHRLDTRQNESNASFYYEENSNHDDIVQIKSEHDIDHQPHLISSPSLVTSNHINTNTNSPSWLSFGSKYPLPYQHRDSISVGIDSTTTTHNTNNGMITAGSNTTESIIKADALKSIPSHQSDSQDKKKSS